MNLGIALLLTVSASLSVFAAENDGRDKKQPPEKAPAGKPPVKPAEAPPADPPAPAAAKAPEAPEAPEAPKGPVPLKFVPAKKGEGRGASGTDLSRKAFDPEARTAMISMGLGDSFPIMDEQGHQLFMLHMTDGDDKHLVLEVRSPAPKAKDAKEKEKEAVQKIAVLRDEVTDVMVNGAKYELRFPTMRVDPANGAVTHEATIFVAVRP